jgi:hypothetical protein
MPLLSDGRGAFGLDDEGMLLSVVLFCRADDGGGIIASELSMDANDSDILKVFVAESFRSCEETIRI